MRNSRFDKSINYLADSDQPPIGDGIVDLAHPPGQRPHEMDVYGQGIARKTATCASRQCSMRGSSIDAIRGRIGSRIRTQSRHFLAVRGNNSTTAPLFRLVAHGAIALLCALVVACGNQDAARGAKFIERLEAKVDSGKSSFPVKDLIDGDPQLVCIVSPYIGMVVTSAPNSDDVERIVRQAAAATHDESSWGLLAIDDIATKRYRFFLLYKNQRGFRASGPDANGRTVSTCVHTKVAMIRIGERGEVTLGEKL